MKSLEPEVILRKLEFLDDYLSQLETIGSISLEDYLSSQITQLAVERLLQLIIQVALDTNRHLLKKLGVKQPETSEETFTQIGKQGILDSKFAKKIAESGKFRNRLVHIYEEIDPQEVYKTIAEILEDFPIYQRQILTYLDSVEARND